MAGGKTRQQPGLAAGEAAAAAKQQNKKSCKDHVARPTACFFQKRNYAPTLYQFS